MEITKDLSTQAQDILTDDNLSKAAKIEVPYGLYNYARPEQRGATESPMIDDDGLNATLRMIEIALGDLGERPSLNDNRIALL